MRDQLIFNSLRKPNKNISNCRFKTDTLLRCSVSKILVFLALILLPAIVKAQGEVIHVKDPGEENDIGPNIKEAWETASDGDTILLPEGSFKIGETAELGYPDNRITNVYLKGRGSGANGTKLYRDHETEEPKIAINFQSTDLIGGKIEISDIWFQGLYPRNDSKNNLMEALHFNSADPKLHHCKFQHYDGYIVRVRQSNMASQSGLIYENTFVDNVVELGDGSYDGGSCISINGPENVEWPNAEPGAEDFIFVEDNFFDTHTSCIVGSDRGKYVFRYNYASRVKHGGHLNMHGNRPDWLTEDYYGTRFIEVYENTFVTSTPNDPWFETNSVAAVQANDAEGVVWGNTYKGMKRGVQLAVSGHWADHWDHPDCPDDWETPDYPIEYQTGWASGVNYGENHTGTDPSTYGEGDFFVWDNEAVEMEEYNYDHTSVYLYVMDSELDGYIQKDRDYHLSKRPGYEPYTYPHPRRDKGTVD